MKIVVCMKQVPDTTEVRIDPVTNTLMREGVPSIINPDDKGAIEAALQIREQLPGTSVTVISMGLPGVDAALREALAMGCDEAVLLTDRRLGGADTLATSTSIAGALRKLEPDLVICGRQAIDGDTAQVGPQMAELLGLPQVTYVNELCSVSESQITVKRWFEDRVQTVQAPLPCLITVMGEMNTPRYMRVGGCFEAYEKDVRIMTYDDIADVVDEGAIGLKGSPTSVNKSETRTLSGTGEVLRGLSTDEAVEAILQRLIELHVI